MTYIITFLIIFLTFVGALTGGAVAFFTVVMVRAVSLDIYKAIVGKAKY